jgi:hypothetical protein
MPRCEARASRASPIARALVVRCKMFILAGKCILLQLNKQRNRSKLLHSPYDSCKPSWRPCSCISRTPVQQDSKHTINALVYTYIRLPYRSSNCAQVPVCSRTRKGEPGQGSNRPHICIHCNQCISMYLPKGDLRTQMLAQGMQAKGVPFGD